MAPIRFGRVSATTAALLLEERSPMMRRRVAAAVVEEEGCVLMAILCWIRWVGRLDDGKDTLLQMMILLDESILVTMRGSSNDPIIIIRLHCISIQLVPDQGYHR